MKHLTIPQSKITFSELPIGTIIPYSAETAPAEWLPADGRAISRANYAELNAIYSAEGYPWGNGDGSTTFNLPDLDNIHMAPDPGVPNTIRVGTNEWQFTADNELDYSSSIASDTTVTVSELPSNTKAILVVARSYTNTGNYASIKIKRNSSDTNLQYINITQASAASGDVIQGGGIVQVLIDGNSFYVLDLVDTCSEFTIIGFKTSDENTTTAKTNHIIKVRNAIYQTAGETANIDSRMINLENVLSNETDWAEMQHGNALRFTLNDADRIGLGYSHNLIARGDCESTDPPMVEGETTPSSSGTGTYQRASDPYSGTYNWELVSDGGGSNAWRTFQNNTNNNDMHGLVPGATYKIHVYAKRTVGMATDECALYFNWYDGSSWQTNIEYINDDDYTEHTITVDVGTDATAVNLYIFIADTATAGETLSIDDVELRRIDDHVDISTPSITFTTNTLLKKGFFNLGPLGSKQTNELILGTGTGIRWAQDDRTTKGLQITTAEIYDNAYPISFWVNSTNEAMIINSSGNIETGGDLNVNGALSKGSGSFKIDHPLKPETHYLIHSFIEGPDADLIYRGKTTLVNGKSEINIDEHSRMTEGTFTELCRNIQCYTTNESGWTAIKGKIEGNKLIIEAMNEDCSDTINWLVIGERQDEAIYKSSITDDKGKIIVEKEKE